MKNFYKIVFVSIFALSLTAFSPVYVKADTQFGNVITNTTASQTVTYTNTTGDVISIQSVQAASDSDSQFSITDKNCAGKQLDNGGQCQFLVNFTPVSSGNFTGHAIITYESSSFVTQGLQTADLYFSGTGTTALTTTGSNSGTQSTSTTNTSSNNSGSGCGNGVVNLSPVQGLFSAQYCSATDAIMTVIRWMMTLIGLVCALFIIWGGFQYITSAGNSEKAESGQKTLTNAAIGLALALLAYTIVAIISNTLANK